MTSYGQLEPLRGIAPFFFSKNFLLAFYIQKQKKSDIIRLNFQMVPAAGIEPAWLLTDGF